ncbi:hypothetical protein DENSPDRAFT_837690 [Dentipellis sp. KUC8613]|nr:hypothetical protein DENSPDRAFT_837690 [Dentipellis sp. KUC8613]
MSLSAASATWRSRRPRAPASAHSHHPHAVTPIWCRRAYLVPSRSRHVRVSLSHCARARSPSSCHFPAAALVSCFRAGRTRLPLSHPPAHQRLRLRVSD